MPNNLPVVTDERWTALGDAVRARRLALGLTQGEAASAAGVSTVTWRSIELASKDAYSGLTLSGVVRALGWPAGAIEQIMAGEATASDLEAASRSPNNEGSSSSADDDDIEIDYNSAIARMPDHVRRAVIELARPYLQD